MTDHKVIDLFRRHRRGEGFPSDLLQEGELVNSPDGFPYLSIRREQASPQDEDELWELAAKRHYLVKMVEPSSVHSGGGTFRINNYHVEGARLEEFLKSLDRRPGKLLEIQPFFPDTTA